MANIKISQLPAATSALGTQEFEVNESGTSKRVTGAQVSTYVRTQVVLSDLGVTASTTEVNKLDGAFDNNSVVLGSSAGGGTGGYNAFVGQEAGQNINNNLNVAVGFQALSPSTSSTSNQNIAVGPYTLTNLTSGSGAVAVGAYAGENLTAAGSNTFVGYLSGRFVTTGNTNLLLGYSSGSSLTTGDNNIVIGPLANVSSATVDNEITIGNGSHKVLRLPFAVTVANLPSASVVGAGARSMVTDADSTTFAAVVAGSGANTVPVYSDGTNWRIG